MAGLRGAIGVPVTGGSGVIAVMTFLSREVAHDDEALRSSLFTVGGQIGSFVERRHTAKDLRESEERFRLLVEGVQDHAILMLDASGTIVSWNSAAMSMTGFLAEEIVGKNVSVFDVESGDFSGLGADEQLEHAREEGRWEGQAWRNRKDGSLYWANISLSALKDEAGRLRGFAMVIRDVTERRRAEEDLLNAKDAAEAANRAKGAFLANMSHEIRTPMNGILGMTELALETDLTPRQREYLGLVKSSTDALLTVINDILDFSKIEAGKLELWPTDFSFRAVVEETVQTQASWAFRKGLELECRIASEVPETVVGDSGRLRQVIINLVGNAIKFTERGAVIVEAELQEAGQHGEPAIHIAISDTGIGIAETKIGTIFAPFEQADNSITRRYGGTGLGLSISSEIVALMGGRIWVDSRVGEGSTFHISLPVGRGVGQQSEVVESGLTSRRAETEGVVASLERDAPVPVGGAADSGVVAGGIVLIADDHLVNQRLAARLLEKAGFKATMVENGKQALEALEASEFDFVLMDLQMPVMDGFEAVLRIRRLEEEKKKRRVPVIALTAHEMQADRERCLAHGFDGFLSKPVNKAALAECISRVIAATRGPGSADMTGAV